MTDTAEAMGYMDPNTWWKAPSWNFAHRFDYSLNYTLCRRRPTLGVINQAEDHDARCPICTSILAEGAL